MNHSPGSSRACGVFAGLAAGLGLLGACSSGDSGVIAGGSESPPPEERSVPALATSAPVPAVPQANNLPPDGAIWEPWQLSNAVASSCVGNAEFVPLGIAPAQSRIQWLGVYSGSSHVYWYDELSLGDGLHTRLFRWSLERGITLIGEYVDAYLLLPSADGNSVVGSRSVDGRLGDAFRWTEVAGTVPLEFIPFQLNASGDVIVGAGEQGLVRWSANTGMQVMDADAGLSKIAGLGSTEALDIIAGSDLDGRAFRWTETGGSVDLGALDGPRSKAIVRGISASGDVIFGLTYETDTSDVFRPFRWTAADGIRELPPPAGTRDDASVVPEYMSTDGRVIVGQVRAADLSSTHPFRWTEAGGMQELLPHEQGAYATHLSESGDVVLGNFGESGSRGFRWTEATGLQEIDPPAWPGIAADGDLIVGTNARGPFVRTFGKLAGTQPEIVSLASPSLVPDGWSEPRPDGISDDGRSLFGEAVNPDGRTQAWLLHPSERCATP